MGLLDNPDDVPAEILTGSDFDMDGNHVRRRHTTSIDMIVTVDVTDKLAAVHAMTDMDARIAYLEKTYREAKKPLVDWFSTHAPVITLANELGASSQMVLRGPEAAWIDVVRRDDSCLKWPGVSVATNDVDWVLDDGVLSRVRP